MRLETAYTVGMERIEEEAYDPGDKKWSTTVLKCPLDVAIRDITNESLRPLPKFGISEDVAAMLDRAMRRHAGWFVRLRTMNLAAGVRQCQSPIEQAFFIALWSVYLSRREGAVVRVCPDPWGDTPTLEDGDLLVEPQAEVGGFHVDFRISRDVPDPFVMGTPAQTTRKAVLVELDGHDFHERTKEQAAKDKSRDRELQAAGFAVYRFTGSEVWRDPVACAMQIIDVLSA